MDGEVIVLTNKRHGKSHDARAVQALPENPCIHRAVAEEHRGEAPGTAGLVREGRANCQRNGARHDGGATHQSVLWGTHVHRTRLATRRPVIFPYISAKKPSVSPVFVR